MPTTVASYSVPSAVRTCTSRRSLPSSVDDVVVGQHVAVGGEDDAGAAARRGAAGHVDRDHAGRRLRRGGGRGGRGLRVLDDDVLRGRGRCGRPGRRRRRERPRRRRRRRRSARRRPGRRCRCAAGRHGGDRGPRRSARQACRPWAVRGATRPWAAGSRRSPGRTAAGESSAGCAVRPTATRRTRGTAWERRSPPRRSGARSPGRCRNPGWWGFRAQSRRCPPCAQPFGCGWLHCRAALWCSAVEAL